MLKTNLILMPSCGYKINLGAACLSAYLKQERTDFTFTDFRTFYNCGAPFSFLGYTSFHYVPEIPDLPLILTIISNYDRKKPLLSSMPEEIQKYVQNRRLNYFSLINNLTNVYNVIDKNIDKFIKYDVLAFTVYDTNFLYTILFSLLIRRKNPGITIIYGGPQVSQHSNAAKLALQSHAADINVIGEGEETLAAILKSLNMKDPAPVKGAMYYDKRKSAFIYQPRKALDLFSLPCPDFSIFQQKNQPLLTLPLYSSRGCIHQCSFCNEWLQFYPYRQLPFQKVTENMQNLHQKYGAIKFDFSDSLLNTSPEWLSAFADELLKKKLNLKWGGFFRAEMSRNLLVKLKKTNLNSVFIGIESFSNSTLKSMKKERSAKDNLKTIELFCSLGINTVVGVIIGFPGSSESEFYSLWKTLIDLKKRYPHLLRINIEPFQLRPMSTIYNHPRSYGLSLVPWEHEVIHKLPRLRKITKQIPMAITGTPRPEEIIRRFDLINSTFSETTLAPWETIATNMFHPHAPQLLYPATRIKVAKDYYKISSIKKINPLHAQFFILHWEGKRFPIKIEECLMLEFCNGILSLMDIAAKVALYLQKDQEECFQGMVKFIDALAGMEFKFEVLSP